MRNKRIVIYCSGNNIKFSKPSDYEKIIENQFKPKDTLTFHDKVRASKNASKAVFLNDLKSLFAPIVDRVYGLIVGKNSIQRQMQDRLYGYVSERRQKDLDKKIQNIYAEANNYIKSNKIDSAEDITDRAGLKHIIDQETKKGNNEYVEALRKFYNSAEEAGGHLGELEAAEKAYERRYRYKPRSKFQQFRDNLGDKFLNYFGMGKNWDPRTSGEDLWSKTYANEIASKVMPENLKQLLGYTTGIADSVGGFMPKKVSDALQRVALLPYDFYQKEVQRELEKSRYGKFLARSGNNVRHKSFRSSVLNPYNYETIDPEDQIATVKNKVNADMAMQAEVDKRYNQQGNVISPNRPNSQ